MNAAKVAALEALQAEYTVYLRVCVDAMIERRRFVVPMSERQAFFPRCSELSSQIVKNARAHAVEIVSGWAGSKYTTKLRAHIRQRIRAGELDDGTARILSIIGKRNVDTPDGIVTRASLDSYWDLLLDENVSGKKPTVSERSGMRLSEMTATLRTSSTTRLVTWWLGFSHLHRGAAQIQLPIVPSPYLATEELASKGILARKTKRGRWRFEVVDNSATPEAGAAPVARVGVDVGLNVVAATSDGRLLGTELKARFDRAYRQVTAIRRNRHRQELLEDSPRLQRLESRLSGHVRSITGRAANALVKAYPAHAFVIEDLDLRGCRGSKRMAYRALHRNLMRKAPCIPVNPAYTSQTCPSCGFVARRNRHGTTFACKFCGRRSHADVVGAQNLLRRSEDKKVTRDDFPSEVRPILVARHDAWRLRHASLCAAGRSRHAPVPSGRRLTTTPQRGLA